MKGKKGKYNWVLSFKSKTARVNNFFTIQNQMLFMI